MSDVIYEFLNIGYNSLIQIVKDLDAFDKKILKWFYDGIEMKTLEEL